MSKDTDLYLENIKQLQRMLINEHELLENKNIEIEVIEKFYQQLVDHLVIISKSYINDLNSERIVNTLPEQNLQKSKLQNNNDNQYNCPSCGKHYYKN